MALQVDLNAIPQRLRDCPRWILWRASEKSKLPLETDGIKVASYKDTSIHCEFELLQQHLKSCESRKLAVSGVGLVLSPDDKVICIDVDSCLRRTESGEFDLLPWAAEVVGKIGSCYVEVSPSGTGVKIFAIAAFGPEHPSFRCRKKYSSTDWKQASTNKETEVLIIREGFATVTGNRLETASFQSSRALHEISSENLTELFRFLNSVSQTSLKMKRRNAQSYARTFRSPRPGSDAASRLLNCRRMPRQTSDGSKLLYALVYFCVEHWSFGIDQICETLMAYHSRTPLLKFDNPNWRAEVAARLRQVKEDMENNQAQTRSSSHVDSQAAATLDLVELANVSLLDVSPSEPTFPSPLEAIGDPSDSLLSARHRASLVAPISSDEVGKPKDLLIVEEDAFAIDGPSVEDDIASLLEGPIEREFEKISHQRRAPK